ncbi:hypothetical protein EGW08_009384 [Elysia chlorotica]|uniref:Uncharacterized protein n=1 Tax=Elysia chlorotica TaxID=188477 RepID=A0A3S1A505_ELYCH|nr:hypothetical protein EGW08_009384 [Elysia chlorotica]
MRRHLREERLARAKSDQKLVHLMIENRRLTEEVTTLKKGQSGVRLAEDESFLESVEASFKQFHAFIDMLREAGMGQLVSMAGLDQSTMPFANSSTTVNGYSNISPGHLNNNNNNNNSNSNSCHRDDEVERQNTTYANMPLASSAFVASRAQRVLDLDPGGSHSMAASFTEGRPVIVGARTGARSSTYDEESGTVSVVVLVLFKVQRVRYCQCCSFSSI